MGKKNVPMFVTQLCTKLNSKDMRERAINTILSLTDAYSREELESIKDTLELVALSLDVKKIKS